MSDIDTKALLEAAKNFGDVDVHEITRGTEESVLIAAVPQGRALQSLKKYVDEYLKAPERRTGTATVTTVKSFIDLVNRFKDIDSAIFADNGSQPSLTAVLDYHPKETGSEHARWCQHRVAYQFPLSPEWLAWNGAASREMSMEAFAQFLEERIIDVRDPAQAGETPQEFAKQLGVVLATPQRLMELSRNLTIRIGQKATNAINLSSGEGKVSFEEKHEGENGAPLSIPGAFVIAIPVFKNGHIWEIPVRLRYRVAGGTVMWAIAPQRTEWLLDAVIKEACEEVEKETALPLFYGAPER